MVHAHYFFVAQNKANYRSMTGLKLVDEYMRSRKSLRESCCRVLSMRLASATESCGVDQGRINVFACDKPERSFAKNCHCLDSKNAERLSQRHPQVCSIFL